MAVFRFECPECRKEIRPRVEGLGFDLVCPHCARNVPVPWENFRSEETRRSSKAPETVDPLVELPALSDESLRSIQVQSTSDRKESYTVNLIDYTCTCPAYSRFNKLAPEREVGRMCKHICKELARAEAQPLLSPICSAMVREGFGIYPGRLDSDLNGNEADGGEQLPIVNA